MPKKEIIAIVNQKGGVGKTTTAISIAAQLASDFSVLLVDLDPQANATSGLGFPKTSDKFSAYNLLLDKGSSLKSVVQKTRINNLSIVCSNADLSGAEVEMVPLDKREYLLKRALEDGGYDYIVIDCPPSLGLLTINALTAANQVLIPVQTEYYALEGLSQLLSTIQAVKQSTNADLGLLGVVLTMFDNRNSLSGQVQSEVAGYFKDLVFKTVIPRNVRLAEAPSFGKTIYEYDKRSKGSRAYKSLAKEIVDRTT